MTQAAISLPAPFARMRRFVLDGAVLAFDRESGISALCDGPHTAELEQVAPRAVLFGITNHCNFACRYCSRPTDADSSWTATEAFELLAQLANAGVLEVAFGGGEPLAFRGFDTLLGRLHDETPLAVGFTTNGSLLTEQRIASFVGKVSQIRVSIHHEYEAAAWRALALLAESPVQSGANLLVTPQVLSRFEDLVLDLTLLGCRDVLVLSYNGPDQSLHLSPAQALDLGRRLELLSLALGSRIQLGLGSCWGSRLGPVPRLDTRAGCGAGRDFISITSNRRAMPCSFHDASFPIASAADVLEVWRAQRRTLASPATVQGCTRLPQLPSAPPARTARRIRVFQAFASNNSGVYALLGSFRKLESLAEAASLLRDLAAAQDAWMQQAEAAKSAAPSPLGLLCERENLEPPYDDETWDYDFSQLTVESLGHQLFVHSPSTVTMPRTLMELMVRKGGRVSIEIDHAHHPVVAVFSFWQPGAYQRQNREERQQYHAALRAELEPLVEELRKPPACTKSEGVPPAWRDEDYGLSLGLVADDLPRAVREMREVAARRGLTVRLQLFEALSQWADPLAELRHRTPAPFGRFQVALWTPGPSPIATMKELRTTLGCSMDEAKKLAQSTPVVVLDRALESVAHDLAKRLQEAGADAEALGPGDFRAQSLKT